MLFFYKNAKARMIKFILNLLILDVLNILFLSKRKKEKFQVLSVILLLNVFKVIILKNAIYGQQEFYYISFYLVFLLLREETQNRQ
jgi:hypothetical protein